jgi:hypothetical protein
MLRFCFLSRLHAAPLALLLCLSIAGCGSGRTEVSGTVRYKGKPLSFGTIQFLSQDGIPYSGTIQPDGTFSVRVPAGQAKVIVSCVDETKRKRLTSQAAAGNGRSSSETSPRAFSLIPQRYGDWNASGLAVLVEGDKIEQDFALNSY